MIVALAGGIGAARFLEGLVHVIRQEDLTVIGNVGDDTEVYGLHVSPDLDIVAYTLAGIVDPLKGWGIRNDTFACQGLLRKYGYETWFNLGDKDLATHIYRTQQLRKGLHLSQVTAHILKRLGLRFRLLPATDDAFQTYIITSDRRIHFQEYMVKLQTRPHVQGIVFNGSKNARPAKGVLRNIRQANGIIVCPSNPVVSIGAILKVPQIRSALRRTKGKIVAVSPIVGGKTIKGPADKLMKSTGVEASAVGVARTYSDFLDTLVLDEVDRNLTKNVESLGMRAVVTDTIMRQLTDKIKLAKIVVDELE